METTAKVHRNLRCHQPLLPLHHHHHHLPLLSRPSSFLSIRTSLPPLSIKASSSSSDRLLPKPKTLNPQFTKTPNPSPFALLKTAVITAIAAATAFSARFTPKPLALAAATVSQTIETLEEKARPTSENIDVEALKRLMEEKVTTRKVDEAIGIVEQLIKLEPDDVEWPVLKAYMRCYNGEMEVAKSEFNEILARDSLLVEAYHGLVMAASQGDSETELKEIENRVEKAMEICRREKKEEDLRDFRLLIAQIRVIEGEYNGALRVYEELVKEDPGDFRPYLCQGIVYTLLREKDEADKQFEKYRSLVPQGHPYSKYFDDNMIATQVLSQKMENARVGLKS